ncbi:Hypothetical_protein [Hexamita inflata]|uniref:Hypothetical_protein n=1 Tax=Hexamita inflata TaxID=28002 RepID=A0ABP1GEN6_9EUKA
MKLERNNSSMERLQIKLIRNKKLRKTATLEQSLCTFIFVNFHLNNQIVVEIKKCSLPKKGAKLRKLKMLRLNYIVINMYFLSNQKVIEKHHLVFKSKLKMHQKLLLLQLFQPIPIHDLQQLYMKKQLRKQKLVDQKSEYSRRTNIMSVLQSLIQFQVLQKIFDCVTRKTSLIIHQIKMQFDLFLFQQLIKKQNRLIQLFFMMHINDMYLQQNLGYLAHLYNQNQLMLLILACHIVPFRILQIKEQKYFLYTILMFLVNQLSQNLLNSENFRYWIFYVTYYLYKDFK